MVKIVKRFEIWKIYLDPTKGSELQKTRPCVVISPDEMNQGLNTVIIAPMSTTGKHYPSRIGINFKGKKGQIILDQIRTVDKQRLLEKIDSLKKEPSVEVSQRLQEMFMF